MSRFGPALVTAGTALLFVPLADVLGALGYALVGSVFVVVGSASMLAPGRFDVDTDGPNRKNCSDCGTPNDPDAAVCSYCETDLS